MRVVAGTLPSGPVTAGTVGWPTADIGLVVLFVLVSVSLGLVGYRWAASEDRTASGETDDESTAVDTDVGADLAHETAHDAPETDGADTGDSGTAATEGALDGGAATPPTADGPAPNGPSALADGAGKPTGVEATTPTETPAGDAGLSAEPDSDEARVFELLEASGGRMKQAHIIEETTWSKSKVSTLLSEMAEEGRITKLRLGRENIICLDGEEPELALSPSDDEQGRA